MQSEQSEKQFMAAVIDLARWNGYRVYHTHDSRKSPSGFPDLVMARSGSPLFLVEVKTETGHVSGAQLDWITCLTHTTGVQAALWRPHDWPEIERLLTTGRP